MSQSAASTERSTGGGRRWPPALVAGAVLLPLAVALAAMVASRAGLSASLGFDVAWTAASLSALIGTLAARSRAHAAHRSRWTLWALAAGSWLFGQVAWDVYGIIGFPASPSVADAGWWGFALLVTGSMLRLPRGPRSVLVVAAVESVPLIVAAVALCVGELWATTVHSHLALAPKISALVYPGLYVSATILMLQAMLGGALRGLRTASLGLVLGGIAAQAVAFMLWSGQLLAGTYSPGKTLLDPLWVAGLAAIAIGALLAYRTPEAVAELREPGQMGVILPAGMFCALFGAFVVARVSGAAAGTTNILEFGLLCSGAALSARSMLLGRRMQALLRRERAALSILAERESELGRLNAQLTEDSRLDPLTGIGNRRALSEDLPVFEALSRERGIPVAVVLCDIDHFKSYNDRLGHLAGDQALRVIAATTRGALRPTDAAYRFGGEELLLILRDVTPHEAVVAAERVRAAVRGVAFVHAEGEGGLLTVSIGVACGEGDLGALLARADAALYDAKRGGRDRVVVADESARLDHPARPRSNGYESPTPRHLRSNLTVSRAAAAGRGVLPVIEALAEALRSELSFQVVAVNLLDKGTGRLRVVHVLGDQSARAVLLDTSSPLSDWEVLLAAGENVHGATWLAAGSYEWTAETPVWTPPGVAPLGSDAWHPEDMLLLPLRNASDEILAIVSVDQPLLGRRPSESEIAVLMAVADHAGLALDQVQREDASAPGQSDELRLAAMMLLAETVDLRDPRTAHHARTVGQLARTTAHELGLGEDRAERIHAAGVLHDLGKLGIADAILQKPGPLGDAEWREIKRHPEVGARILEHAGMRDIAAWVRSHHERVDGLGYPDAISGHLIPLEARILAVCDSYEAMIADRPYHAGIPREDARTELIRCAGAQFDPEVVTAFLRALDRAGASHAVGALEHAA